MGAKRWNPDGSTVNLTGFASDGVFTALVLPGESITVDGTTYTAAAGNTNREPMHFAMIAGTIERIGAN